MFSTLIIFIAILALLVFVHEFGHFFTARKAKVKVKEFGIGFPPRIFGVIKNSETGKWQKIKRNASETNTTIYSLNLVPLGGFVKIKGEEGENINDADSFAAKTVGKRIWILSSGVLMNVILTIVLLTFGFIIGLPQVIDETTSQKAKISEEKITIVEVMPGLPAQKEGIQLGDSLVSIDGQRIKEIPELQNYLSQKIGQKVFLVLDRGGELITKEIVPEKLPQTETVGIGMALVKTGTVSFPWYLALYQAILTTAFLLKAICLAIFQLFKNLVITHQAAIEVAGPVGIAILTGQVAKLGFIYILQFTALLSLNLAIINFLPFPALDGGRVLFLLIEKIRGKAVNQKIEALIHNIGFMALLILIILVTFKDISRFSGGFSDLFGKFFGS